MEFTEKETQKYNGVSKQDLIDFKNREVVYQSTQSSCLGSENAVLTLENERVFNEDMNKFFERLRNSKRISDYEEEKKQTEIIGREASPRLVSGLRRRGDLPVFD